MGNSITRWIGRGGWQRFLVWTAINIAVSVWAFVLPGPWTRLAEATGDGGPMPRVPEVMFGFPQGQPAQAMAGLADVTRDYLLFLAMDVPYFVMGSLMVASGIAVGLKRFGLAASPARWLLLVPIAVVAAEAVENLILAGMAVDILPREGALALIQQTMTTTKFVSYGVGTVAMLAAVIASLGAMLASGARGGKAS